MSNLRILVPKCVRGSNLILAQTYRILKASSLFFYKTLHTLKGQYQTETSGASPWTFASYDVPEAEHTFRWSYVKDGAGGATDCDNTDCEDAAWIDDIVFPPAYMESENVLGDLNGDSIVNIVDEYLPLPQ